MAEKNAPKKTIIDVSHPDDTAPTDTSKAVLVGNRPMLKDPMMLNQTDKTEGPQAAPELEDTKEDKPEVVDAKVVETKEVAEEKVIKADEPKENSPETEPAEPVNSEEAPVAQESFTDEEDHIKDPEDESKQQDEEQKREAEVQKLIDSKQYYLPINTVEKRRTHRVVVLGIMLSVILAAAWLNVALDAELISVPGLKAVTHFF